MFSNIDLTSYHQPQLWHDHVAQWEQQRQCEITQLSIGIFLAIAMTLAGMALSTWIGISIKGPIMLLHPFLTNGVIMSIGIAAIFYLGTNLHSRLCDVDDHFYMTNQVNDVMEESNEQVILKKLPYHVRNVVDSFCNHRRLCVTQTFSPLITKEQDSIKIELPFDQHAQRMRHWVETQFNHDEPILAVLDSTNAILLVREREEFWVIGSEYANRHCVYLHQKKSTKETKWIKLLSKSEACSTLGYDYLSPKIVLDSFEQQLKAVNLQYI